MPEKADKSAGVPPGMLPPRIPEHAESEKSHLGVVSGLAALSPDALSSVAYGPEAIVAALFVAGTAAIALTLPVVIVLSVLLLVLTVSYCQVIVAHPDGGGAYAVAKASLGGPVALVAAASLVVDYVLTAAVGLAAGAEALASAFPALQSHLLVVSLVGLALLTVLNLWGIAESARVLLVPIALFIVAILAIIIGGLASHPPSAASVAAQPGAESGFPLFLKAFAAGCVALTGIEAIANGVPAFREPRARHAQQTEIALGAVLITMLLGLAVVIRIDHIAPKPGLTLLAQIASNAFGHGVLYKVILLVVTLVLGLAANTSFGGLPVLLSLLAKDNRAPHLLALRAERPVYRVGVIALAIVAGLLLLASNGRSAKLLPLYAIGVFVGFTISQTGMVRQLWPDRRRWGPLVVCAVGALLTFVTTFILLTTKFTEGAWIVLVAIPVFVMLFGGSERYYKRLARDIALFGMPAKPHAAAALVIVPVADVSSVTRHALDVALGLGRPVTAVSVKDADAGRALRERWNSWAPEIPLEIIYDPHTRVIDNVVEYACEQRSRHGRVIVVIPRLRTRHRWQQILHNQRTIPLAGLLLRHYGISVCATEYDVGGRRK